MTCCPICIVVHNCPAKSDYTKTFSSLIIFFSSCVLWFQFSEPRARPKLQLAPRTRPIENPLPPPEEIKEKEKPAEAPAPAPPVPRASIFGAAKPVDTQAREREIEERLARERDRAPRRDDSDRITEAPR